MKSSPKTLKSVLSEHRTDLITLLKKTTPIDAAAQLERDGWSREWACKAVEYVEVSHNPAKLVHGPVQNQKIRESLQTQVTIGVVVFCAGLVVTLLTLIDGLSGGGVVIIAYGAIISGAVMVVRAFPLLKKHPNRRLPRYVPPKDSRAHDPGEY